MERSGAVIAPSQKTKSYRKEQPASVHTNISVTG
jgi:hypothetical protein